MISDLYAQLTELEFIDLTHTNTPNMPAWPGLARFSSEIPIDYDKGCRVMTFSQGVGIGIHMDSPAHFLKNTKTISDYTIADFIDPLCVIDIREKVKKDPDYLIVKNDIKW